ncbi:hypothetical protein MTBPR1_120099 [Candidatus Terasakiella magnetica]|uniref:Uncharacterized protein n=1 Tax=Candidatus Terasakiella magnetica TaxID=1867952 RepID=A0A1C3RES0_9PROT|nr:hypothetical protein [Candidatus Terasakiella magnetica]SCA55793.1 hypothetical protein MTBPR1_120099 [Candidatus Terasakiella magnetica]
MLKQINQGQQEVMDWFNGYDWSDSYIYTLTFPSNIAINRERMMKNVRYFWNRVDKEFYGNLSQAKQPFRCVRINMLESGFSRMNHHVHGIVSVPQNPKCRVDLSDSEALLDIMEYAWENGMDFNKGRSPSAFHMADADGYGYTHEEWVSYITKTVTDRDFDAFCDHTSWLWDGQKLVAA